MRKEGRGLKISSLSKGTVFASRERGPESIMERLRGLRRWKILDLCHEPCPTDVSGPDEIRVARQRDAGFLTFAASAHMVIVDALKDLSAETSSSTLGPLKTVETECGESAGVV